MRLIYSLIIAFILSNFGCESFANSLPNEIAELYATNKEVDDEIFKRLTFEISDFQPILGGLNAKCILKGNDGRLWFLKLEDIFTPLDAIYRFHMLCGQNMPVGYNIKLPINGKYRTAVIQEFIMDAKTLGNIPINKLSKDQIEYVQKQQIIDWFILGKGIFECCPEQFLLKGNEIINVDKSRAFLLNYATGSLSGKPNYLKNYYDCFWRAYINREIEVDFTKSFEMIDYIQSFDDSFIKTIFEQIKGQGFPLSLLIERKYRLRSDFEKYYRHLAKKRGGKLELPSLANIDQRYSTKVIKTLRENIQKKKIVLNRLKRQKQSPQRDIGVIMSKDGRDVIAKSGFLDSYYSKDVIDLRNALDKLKRESKSPYERLGLYLTIKEMRHLGRGITNENFFEIQPFVAYSPNTIDIGSLESNLTATSYEKEGFYLDTIDKYMKTDDDTLNNILYILNVGFTFNNPEQVMNRYRQNKFDKESCEILDILDMDSIDRNYIPEVIERLKRMDDRSEWKHFLISFFYYQMTFWHSCRDYRYEAITELNKVINLASDKRLSYISYLFLGYLYEHNRDCFRFKEGFNISKAIKTYERAVELKPESIIAHLNLAVLYLIKGSPAKAWDQFNYITKSSPQFAAKQFHFEEGFYDKFIALNKTEQIKMLKMHSLDRQQHYIIGSAYSIKGNRDLASKHFNEAEKLGYLINENY